MIESITNTKIKYANKLKQKKYRNQFDEFLVEGEHLVEEAIKSENARLIFSTETVNFPEIEIEYVTKEVFKKLSELGQDAGLIAICKKPNEQVIADKILVLDAVQDPGNMGTLIRSAAAFGFKTIISENSVDYYNEKVIRASQGAIFYVDLHEANINDFILQHRDYHYYGTAVNEGTDIKNIDLSAKKIAIVLGNEGNGIRENIRILTDVNITIPMQSTESLNVAVAGGIMMYETCRRK